MQIILNGETFELAPSATLTAIVEQLSLAGKRFAIEVNEEIVPRSEHAEFNLKEGDCVEVVQAIGGG